MSKRTPEPEAPKRPEKPTKNGHYMGLTCGFDFEDGKYRIAPAIYQGIDKIIEEGDGLAELVAAQQKYLQCKYDELAKSKKAWWRRVYEEYGLEGNYSYTGDGWLIPIKEGITSCDFCREEFTSPAGYLDHRMKCEKDPLAIKVRELEATLNAVAK